MFPRCCIVVLQIRYKKASIKNGLNSDVLLIQQVIEQIALIFNSTHFFRSVKPFNSR